MLDVLRLFRKACLEVEASCYSKEKPVKGGENVTILFKMIPTEQKQNTVPQNVSNKAGTNSDKSAKGFAKALTVETDKNESNAGSKVKVDDKEQLMAAMASMLIPRVVNLNLAEQAISDTANTLEETASVAEILFANPVPVMPNIQFADAMTGGDIGLATLLPQKTAVTTQMDSTQLGEFVELQTQAPLQMENKSIIKQVEVTEISMKNTEMVMKDPTLSNIIPSLTTMGNTSILGKNSNKQLEGKNIAMSQTNVEATKAANTFGVIESVDVKPMLPTQESVIRVSNLAGNGNENISILLGTKEQLNADFIPPNQSVKNIDVFASLLNQQGIKIENQGVLEAKQVAPQPMSEPYNITSQIVDQTRLIAKNQNTEMIIQLKPEHLGELTFKVSIEKGIVSASFHSNNAEVRSIIESSLAQLKQDLSNQGLKIDNVGVYAGLGQFFSNGQQSGGNQQPAVKVQNKKNEEEFLNLFEVNESADRALDASGVDYRV